MNQTAALSYVHFHPAKEETCTVFVSFVITAVNATKKWIITQSADHYLLNVRQLKNKHTKLPQTLADDCVANHAS